MGVSVNAVENPNSPYVNALEDMGFLIMQWALNPWNWLVIDFFTTSIVEYANWGVEVETWNCSEYSCKTLVKLRTINVWIRTQLVYMWEIFLGFLLFGFWAVGVPFTAKLLRRWRISQHRYLHFILFITIYCTLDLNGYQKCQKCMWIRFVAN